MFGKSLRVAVDVGNINACTNRVLADSCQETLHTKDAILIEGSSVLGGTYFTITMHFAVTMWAMCFKRPETGTMVQNTDILGGFKKLSSDILVLKLIAFHVNITCSGSVLGRAAVHPLSSKRALRLGFLDGVFFPCRKRVDCLGD